MQSHFFRMRVRVCLTFRTVALNPDLLRRMAVNTIKNASKLTMDKQHLILAVALKDAAAACSESPAYGAAYARLLE